MPKDYVEDSDSPANRVTFNETRLDWLEDPELKLHKRFGTVDTGAKDQIGVDLMVDNRFPTVTCYFASLADFKEASELIFKTMRQNYPIHLYLHDHDGTAVYNGVHVMPKMGSMNYDQSRGAQFRVEAKFTFALAAYFVI